MKVSPEMHRRRFALGLAVATALPGPVLAQSGGRVRSIGVLLPLAEIDPEQAARRDVLRESLEQRGWSDGRNLRIEYRYAGSPEKFAPLAKEMVASRPDVIFVQSSGFIAAVRRETRTIPVVFTGISDPIGAGFVASLAHPGGNLTGVLLYEAGVPGKWLAMLKEISPKLTRATVMANPKTTLFDYFLRAVQAAAPSLGVAVMPSRVETADAIESALKSIGGAPEAGLIVAPDSTMLRNRKLIIDLAARHGVPAVYPERVYAVDGGLMAYGIAGFTETFQQAGFYVDRILRGEKPADLPVQQPTKYSTVINVKTAKALGLTVPSGLLVAADEVIE